MMDSLNSLAKTRGLESFDQHQLQALLKEGYKLTPATLAHKITRGQWIPARHLLYISTEIATAIRKGGQFVIVSMPPRHGKSEFISVHTPVWFLEHWPDKYVGLASYGAELATEFSLKVRDHLLNEENFQYLSVRLRKEAKRVDNFKTTRGGGMLATGIGGSFTGRGAHLLIIDDYIKNAEEALSKTQKEKAWNWFLSTAFTRLEPGGTVIILATRWDHQDLIGMVLELWEELAALGFQRPTIINLPALARENDPLGRAPGEPLWPERYDEQALMRIRYTLGTYWWDALYQQDPPLSMNGMRLGEKIKVISPDELPHHSLMKTVRVWDLAATPDDGGGTKSEGDYTASLKMHIHKGNGKIFLEKGIYTKKSPKQVEQIVRVTAEDDGVGVPIWFEQEPGSAGKTLIEHYIHEVLPEFSVRGEKATGPIEVRAAPFLAAIEGGMVHAVAGEYVGHLKAEVEAFPEADHDDLVVCGALGYRKLCRGRFGGIIWGRDRGTREAPVTSGDPIRRRMGGLTW